MDAPQMCSIILEGEVAVEERRRMLEDGKEISVAVRERNSRCKMRTYGFEFGMNSSFAWVFCRDEAEGSAARLLFEGVPADKAVELFQGYLERIQLRRCLIDPSPLSPDMVEISPYLEDVVQDLEAEFGIIVPLS